MGVRKLNRIPSKVKHRENTKTNLFREETQYNLVDKYHCLEGGYCLHFQCPEFGGRRSLRNVATITKLQTASHRRQVAFIRTAVRTSNLTKESYH
jgi:hypothetical protein